MRHIRAFVVAAMLAVVFAASTSAVTRVPSADGQYWDIQDTSTWSQDSGGIATGGGANPFNGFGYLKLEVSRATGAPLVSNQYLRGFGLSHDGAERFDSITPVLSEGVIVARSLYAPKAAQYLRYFDTFTNTTAEPRVVRVAWGGAAGAYEDGGRVTVAATSNGNRAIDAGDTFVTVMQNATSVNDPMQGPSGHGPSAHVLGNRAGAFTGAGDMYGDPFTSKWPGYDPAHIGYLFTLRLEPGQTSALVTFVVKGLSEVYDPRGGFPVTIKDGLVGGGTVYEGADKKVPAPGTEIAKVIGIARTLAAEPDLSGLTPRQLGEVVNWTIPRSSNGRTSAERPSNDFSVVEKSVSELQAAMASGIVTSEDIVREYLARLTLYDRHGPTLRSMLAINPRVIADARARDAERAAGNVRGVFHGIPIVLKDNIDALELPTTGGSLALVDHHPRLDSHVAAGMKRGGAIILGKANLDEFPFGDFGISAVGGTVGNAYDPSLSTAGSSGGSASATAASLAALAFGTDTCNSLSNPSGFQSLSTIRATRGLNSRAGVMPLNTFNDAVGPMGRSVKDVALALDLVAGADPEDPVTAEANRHISGSFADGLDTATLKGRRFGVLRQRFVGITGEREVAAILDRVVADLRKAGATVIEVSIDDYDAKYRAARGSAPGSLKAGWEAYLSRGAKPGERVLTLEDLLASGKLAPVSARRFQDALQPTPQGAALQQAIDRFYTGRFAFRKIFEDLMQAGSLDALVYPANQARPHTHEGGQIRYGSEPGTCEESAATGLPQVTVPAGFMADRYPAGVSFLGRMWTDKQLLEIAAAYEKATHHRRPPRLMP